MKKHQNFPYIFNRIKQMYFQKINPQAPWLTEESIHLLLQLIGVNDVGLEFGSGRSTLWFSKRCKYLHSFEHNQIWYNIVNKSIAKQENIDYKLLTVSKDDYSKSTYLTYIEDFPDQSIDFILNDGKLRDIVALKSLRLLKPGGLYIIDNAERYLNNSLKLPQSIGNGNNSLNPNWHKFSVMTDAWRRIWTTDGISATLILFKP